MADLIDDAIRELREAGYVVERALNVPGLWYVAGFPELTTNQLLDLAYRRVTPRTGLPYV